MKYVLALMALLISVKANGTEIVVLAGQSNAQGLFADATGFPHSPYDATIPFSFFNLESNSGGQWTTLGPQPGKLPAGNFGPEVSFAQTMASEGESVAVFKYTIEGTSLGQWKAPGDGGLYDDMMRRLAAALPSIDRPHVAVLIWIQGESDAADANLTAAYESRLRLLIADFRAKVNGPDVPVLLSVDEQHQYVVANPGVVTAQQNIAASVPRVSWISMRGLQKRDTTHLTADAVIAQGKILFLAFKLLEERHERVRAIRH